MTNRKRELHSLLILGAMTAERAVQMVVGLFVLRAIATSQSTENFVAWQIAFSIWAVMTQISNTTGERVMLPRLSFGRGALNTSTSSGAVNDTLKSMLAAKLISGSLAAAALLFWTAGYYSGPVVVLGIIWAAYVFVDEPANLAGHELLSRERFTIPIVSRLLGLLVRAILVALIYFWQGPVYWYALAWLTGLLTDAAVLNGRWQHRFALFTGRINWLLIRSVFLQGAALAFAATAAAALPRIDRLVYGGVLPLDTIAQYSGAMTLLEALFAMGSVMTTVLGARFLFKDTAVLFTLHLGYACAAALAGLIVAALLYWQVDLLINVILGDRFSDSIGYFRSGLPLVPIVLFQAVLQTPLLPRAHNSFHLIKAVSGFVVGALVSGIGIAHGHYGQIIAGVYAGYLTFIVFDLVELARRRATIYRKHTADAALPHT